MARIYRKRIVGLWISCRHVLVAKDRGGVVNAKIRETPLPVYCSDYFAMELRQGDPGAFGRLAVASQDTGTSCSNLAEAAARILT
jgi:hypothetical protein